MGWGSTVVRASSRLAATLLQHGPRGHPTLGRTAWRSATIRVVAVSAGAIQGARAIGKRQSRGMIGENALPAQRRRGSACGLAGHDAYSMPRVPRCLLISTASDIRHVVSAVGATLASFRTPWCSPSPRHGWSARVAWYRSAVPMHATTPRRAGAYVAWACGLQFRRAWFFI